MTDPESNQLRIIELYVENVKYVRAARVNPKGDMVIVAGRNSQGKTSLMDALAMALGGKELVPAKPLRAGQKSGKVIVDLEKYRVERRFTEKGSQLYVTGKEGESYRSPQALLDGLVGDLTFDPSEFITKMKPSEQLATLQKLVGVDLSDLNTEYDQKFRRRTDVSRDVKALEAVVRDLPHHADAPIKEIEVGDLATRLQGATAHNAGLINAQNEIKATVESLSAAIDELQRYESIFVFLGQDNLRQMEQDAGVLGLSLLVRRESHASSESIIMPLSISESLNRCQTTIEGATKRRDTLIGEKMRLEASLEDYIGKYGGVIDTEALVAEYDEATELNKKIRENIKYREKDDELKIKRDEAAALTTRLDEIEREKHDRLAAAQFPVPGLSFDDDGVTFNSAPFGQASSSDQIRVSFAMALELNKDKPLRICLIRNGAFLDDDNLALIEEMAGEARAQVWIERVSGDGKATVIIEEGRVKDAA